MDSADPKSAQDPSDLKSTQESLTASLVRMSRTVAQLAQEDLSFYRSFNKDAAELIDEQSARMLELTNKLMKTSTTDTNVNPPTLTDKDSVDEKWSAVVDVADSLLERADNSLDEFTGVIKKLTPAEEEQAPVMRKTSKFATIYDYGPSKIPKPQLQFDRKVDTSDITPFKPLLNSKPHAKVSLEKSLQKKQTQQNGHEGYSNPYELEIRTALYPENVYDISPPIAYLPFESTTATFVDTLDGVKEMLKELKGAKEIAIDLEHHDVHSYHGLVSLMQISTRAKDWVVDTLKPWREELQMLNEVFADPNILKVFHGATMDIIWLQRDLGLYVVNLFDTFHAASALGFPKKSLKYLLHEIVNFEADKTYQMADWRTRPLPQGMFDYARSDTHYLLFIYDNLRNQLIEASTPDPEGNLIDYVRDRSKNECLQRYERPVYDEANGQGSGGWYDMLTRNPGTLSKEQFAVFRAVHQWRDKVAREEDEGVQCVFPKHILFKVSAAMPTNMGTLLRTISPMTPITKDRADDLLDTIKQAKIDGGNGPEWRDIAPRPKGPPKTQPSEPKDASNVIFASPTKTSWSMPNVMAYKPKPLPSREFMEAAVERAIKLAIPYPEDFNHTISEGRVILPTDNAEPSSSNPQDSQDSQDSQEYQDSPTSTPQPPEKKIFTVKEKGRPQKRKVTPVDQSEPSSSGIDNGADQVSLDADYSTTDSKKSRKEKKAAKKAQKAAKAEAESTPFDYGAADSVLNAPSAQAPQAQPKNKKTFDPYRKALEAPSGVRKIKRDMSGKSLTFRK